MRKTLLLLLMLILTFTSTFASGSNNPSDVIYSDIDRWNNLGLIDRLPPIRPYPTQYLLSILNQVKESGNKTEAKVAETYIEYYTNTNLSFELRSNNFTSFDEAQTISGLGADGNINLSEKLTAGIDISAYILNDVDNAVTDPVTPTGISVNEDNMGFNAFGEYWNIYQSLDVNAAYGDDKLWIQTGMMNTSFGPLFDDSVVMSGDANQSAHFSTTWIADKFTLSYLFMPIVATDSEGDNESDDKYIHIHSLDFKITNWWDFQFYETVVYGGNGVKPIFFLPFSEFFYSASEGGTWDVNSLMGVSSRFQLPNNISLTGTVYVDDIAAKDIITLNFDTRYKLAAQGELEWTVEDSFLNNITLSYTAIMPYMYTHTTVADEDNEYFDLFGTDYDVRSYALYTDMNYENYTNGGLTMGPYGMEPNSDKIGLSISMDAPHGFKVNLSGLMQRHGNSSSTSDRSYSIDTVIDTDDSTEYIASTVDYNDDGSFDTSDAMTLTDFYDTYDSDQDGVIDDAVPTDGTIFDAGYGWTGGYLHDNDTPFLSQDVLEYLFVAKLSVTSPTIEAFDGEIYGNLGYTYVYIENQDLVEGDTFSNSYVNFSVNYKF